METPFWKSKKFILIAVAVLLVYTAIVSAASILIDRKVLANQLQQSFNEAFGDFEGFGDYEGFDGFDDAFDEEEIFAEKTTVPTTVATTVAQTQPVETTTAAPAPATTKAPVSATKQTTTTKKQTTKQTTTTKKQGLLPGGNVGGESSRTTDVEVELAKRKAMDDLVGRQFEVVTETTKYKSMLGLD